MSLSTRLREVPRGAEPDTAKNGNTKNGGANAPDGDWVLYPEPPDDSDTDTDTGTN